MIQAQTQTQSFSVNRNDAFKASIQHVTSLHPVAMLATCTGLVCVTSQKKQDIKGGLKIHP